MRMSDRGFTLIEVAIAVAISAVLVGGIYAALVSTQRTSAIQAMDAGKEASRMRAVELLKSDLRARLSMKMAPGVEGGTALTLSTTADSVALGEMKRMLNEVRYIASEKGLKRQEGKGSELDLGTGEVAFEFWEKGAWRKSALGDPLAVRVIFATPQEALVIR